MFALADCNNFFVSCERVFRPDLARRAVVVLSNNDGCVVSRSNEAKQLGIKMGEPLFRIRHLVDSGEVVAFSGNMELYGDMSRRVRSVLEECAPAIEVYSIDEAFLDLRGVEGVDFDAFAKNLSARCYKLTSIPISVGVAPTKTLAKIASKLCKSYPKLCGGCYMHRPQDIEKVLRKFPIEDVWGIGRRTTAKLQRRGVKTAYDFTQMDEEVVLALFGVTGHRTWRELRGEACIEFEDFAEPRQSVTVSRSFAKEIYDRGELCEQIANFASSVAAKLRKQHSVASEFTIFAATNRFREGEIQGVDSTVVSLADATADERVVVNRSVRAMAEIFRSGRGYKKAGVTATKIVGEGDVVHSLFEDSEAVERERKITQAMDSINSSFGRGTIRLAVQGSGDIRSLQSRRSPRYTTLWSEIPKVYIK